MLIPSYPPPRAAASAEIRTTRCFLQRGIPQPLKDVDRMALVYLFGAEAKASAIRLRPGQGRAVYVKWAEAGIVYPPAVGPVVLIGVDLPSRDRPAVLRFDAVVGGRQIILSVAQTSDRSYAYTNLSRPTKFDPAPRRALQRSCIWSSAPWDGWFRLAGPFAIQEARQVGNRRVVVGIPAATAEPRGAR